MDEHRYLTGNFAPVHDELSVTSLIPRALAGRLVRSGPNPIAPDPGNYHWFLGNGPDDVFIGGDNAANTHVVAHAGKILASRIHRRLLEAA